jgi:hypothetical protein
MRSPLTPPTSSPADERKAGADERASLFQSAVVIVCSFLALGGVLVFFTTSLAPAAKPLAGTSRPAATASAGDVSFQPAVMTAVPETLPPATPSPVPAASATPYRLVPSPVRATATFTVEPGHECAGMPRSLSDVLIFSTANGQLTIRQPSTGGVSSGPIDPTGTFAVRGSVVHETYTGRISGGSATAENVLESGGCTATYGVAVHFLVAG